MSGGGWIFVALVVLAVFVDLFDRLWERLQVDIDEGGTLPDRWLAWGNIKLFRQPDRAPVRRYFLLRLPSYGCAYSLQWDGLRWHQYVIARFWTIAPDAQYRQLIRWCFIAPPIHRNRLTTNSL